MSAAFLSKDSAHMTSELRMVAKRLRRAGLFLRLCGRTGERRKSSGNQQQSHHDGDGDAVDGETFV